MKYAIADTKGIFKTYTDLSVASLDYYIYVQAGIEVELSIQNQTGLTMEQIEERVKSSYRLVKIQESK